MLTSLHEQVVIAVAEMKMRNADPRFPIGQTRLETVGVVACAVIMTLSTIEVIQSSAGDLVIGWTQGTRQLRLSMTLVNVSARHCTCMVHCSSCVCRLGNPGPQIGLLQVACQSWTWASSCTSSWDLLQP